MFSRPKILFLVSLLFVALLNFNPYLPFKFLIFYHSSFVYFLYMLSIHINLSAGAQNFTGAYVIIMLVNNALTWQSSCVIANNARKTAKAICPRL